MNDEINQALIANDWKQQLLFIEKIENLLLDEEDVLDDSFISSWLTVLFKYLESGNKNVIQRTLRVLEAIGQFRFSPPKEYSIFCHSLALCLCDARPNIRQQTIRTMVSLSKSFMYSNLLAPFDTLYSKFPPESKSEIIQFLTQNKESIVDWKPVLSLIISCIEDKSLCLKNSLGDMLNNDPFLDYLEKNHESISEVQKKALHPFFEKINTQTKSAEENQPSPIKEKEPEPEIEPIFLNTSAFSRKGRNNNMNEDDGLKLLSDTNAYNKFNEQLSLDVRDVFDDDLANLLLSSQYQERIEAVSILRKVFKSNQTNFQNSIDIIIRWCGMQFIRRQISVAQSSLLLLIDHLGSGVQVSRIELIFILPIVLWSITTKSDAYTDLLVSLRKCSSNQDYSQSIIKCLVIKHPAVISTVFEELECIDDISSIETQLKELSRDKIKCISDPSKSLLLRIAPKTSMNNLDTKNMDPIIIFQNYIQRIRSVPDFITDPQNILSFLIEQFGLKPSEDKFIRYLLYCTHSFLSEPILTAQIDQREFIPLLKSILSFSLSLSQQYLEAINSIGFIIVTVLSPLPLFDSLINFFENNWQRINRQSFSYHLFSTANSLLCLDRVGSDLMAIRTLAKQSISHIAEATKDDLRIYLFKSLLGETVALEQQRLMQKEIYLKMDDSDTKTVHRKQAEIPKPDLPISERLLFVSIVDKLGTPSLRNDGIHALIEFDEENGCNGSAINAVCKLVPSLKHDLDHYKKGK